MFWLNVWENSSRFVPFSFGVVLTNHFKSFSSFQDRRLKSLIVKILYLIVSQNILTPSIKISLLVDWDGWNNVSNGSGRHFPTPEEFTPMVIIYNYCSRQKLLTRRASHDEVVIQFIVVPIQPLPSILAEICGTTKVQILASFSVTVRMWGRSSPLGATICTPVIIAS